MSTELDALPGWLAPLGRVGYAAKGLVYLLVGALALMAALGLGGSVGGSKNALAEVGSMPFGRVLLGIVAAGLAAYGLYKLTKAWVDPGNEGRDAQGVGTRFTYVVTALLHVALAVQVGSMALGSVFGSGGGGAESGGPSETSATLMEQPGGVWLVALVGLVVAGFGLRQFQRAYQAKFLENYERGGMSASTQRAAKHVGQAGLVARGLVFVMIGGFFVKAALEHDPDESKGLDGALRTLLEQPYGRLLLGLAAAGLAAYGVFCFSYARYRDFRRT